MSKTITQKQAINQAIQAATERRKRREQQTTDDKISEFEGLLFFAHRINEDLSQKSRAIEDNLSNDKKNMRAMQRAPLQRHRY